VIGHEVAVAAGLDGGALREIPVRHPVATQDNSWKKGLETTSTGGVLGSIRGSLGSIRGK